MRPSDRLIFHCRAQTGLIVTQLCTANGLAYSANKTVTQSSITAAFNANAKATADAAVAKMFFANGISFSIVESKHVKDAFTAVSKCGAGYKLPNRAMLSGKLLQEAVLEVDNKLKEFKTQMCVTGATLISDGWTNVQNRPIINYLSVTPDGAMFIDGSDMSGEVKDAQFIADEIKRNIEYLGKENIVQVSKW